MNTISVEGAVDIDVGGASSRLTGHGDRIVVESSTPVTLLAETLAALRSTGTARPTVALRHLARLVEALPPVELAGPDGLVLRSRPGRRIPVAIRRPVTVVHAWWRSRPPRRHS